jgi:hypothetical protein
VNSLRFGESVHPHIARRALTSREQSVSDTSSKRQDQIWEKDSVVGLEAGDVIFPVPLAAFNFFGSPRF